MSNQRFRKYLTHSITQDQENLGMKLMARVYRNAKIGLSGDEHAFLVVLGALRMLNVERRKTVNEK